MATRSRHIRGNAAPGELNMLTLTARTRIAELQQGPPALLATLKSTGLFRDGDDPELMLGELCWTFGFNPGILLMMLESANVPEEIPPLDVAPYEAMPLIDLVDHIERTHHVYLRENLPRLTAMTEAVASAFGQDERLAELCDEMRSIAAELDAHLGHEEEALFPMVRDIETKGSITPTRCGGSVGGPIACMENEHEMAARSLRKMRELTDNYTAPAAADGRWREMLEGLSRFDQDLQEHMYKENKVLFPRALDAQSNRGRDSSRDSHRSAARG
jgi:regulator of cell morphogenesis and NO signaling